MFKSYRRETSGNANSSNSPLSLTGVKPYYGKVKNPYNLIARQGVTFSTNPKEKLQYEHSYSSLVGS